MEQSAEQNQAKSLLLESEHQYHTLADSGQAIVETPEQLAFLQAQGCDLYQGYLKSPLPAEDFVTLLRKI